MRSDPLAPRPAQEPADAKAGYDAPVPDSAPPQPVRTDAVMAEIRDRLKADLHERLVARGAAEDFDERAIFDEVDALFRRALALDDRHALLLPELLAEPWRPELSLRLKSHRGGLAAATIVFVKRRVLLPLTRWLYEYTHENFRRQERLNHALLASLQSLAAEHARLKRRLDAIDAGRAGPPR